MLRVAMPRPGADGPRLYNYLRDHEDHMPIHYLIGDATRPQGEGQRFIIHICNDEGRWGKGFSGAISHHWKRPELAYRAWSHDQGREATFGLGKIQVLPVTPHITVVNMVAQSGFLDKHRPELVPLRLGALYSCICQVAKYVRAQNATIHMPRIGCGLGGGKWEDIEELIQEKFEGIDVFVYDLPE